VTPNTLSEKVQLNTSGDALVGELCAACRAIRATAGATLSNSAAAVSGEDSSALPAASVTPVVLATPTCTVPEVYERKEQLDSNTIASNTKPN
jgi:hypothetical protein